MQVSSDRTLAQYLLAFASSPFACPAKYMLVAS